MKIYPKALEAFLNGDIDLAASNIKVALVSASYTQSDAHDFLNDITGVLGTSGNLSSKTLTSGTFDFDDPDITISANGTIVAAIVYEDTGTSSTSHLIAFDDKQADGSTAISRAVLIGDIVTVQVHASGLFDL